MLLEVKLVEMERNRENALCCGTSAWMECSGYSPAELLDILMHQCYALMYENDD